MLGSPAGGRDGHLCILRGAAHMGEEKNPDRTITRQELRASEQRFRDLFEHAPLCVFEADFSADPPRVVQASRRATETYGWSQEEFVGLELTRLVPAEAEEDFARSVGALRAGRAVTVNSMSCRRDGTVFPVRVSASVSPTTGARRAVVMVEDVTLQSQALEARRQAVATARALLNATHDRAVLLELDGTIVELNEEAARALGGTAERLRGRAIRDFFPEKLTELRRQYAREVTQTGRPQRWQDVREEHTLENCLYPVFDEQGRVVRLAGFARDVTEQQQAQAALRQAKERLQRIVDNTWDIIFQMNLSGRYTFGNKAAERITGYRLDQLLRMNFSQLIAPEYMAMVYERLQARMEGKELPQPFSFEFVRADGSRACLELSTTGVYEDGKLVGIQGIARDITGRQRTERALREAHRKLMTARDDERRRVARELHDSVGQQLAALRMVLRNTLRECEAERMEPAHELLNRASDICNALVREVRDICQGLYPATLESLGLAAALRELGSQCPFGPADCRCEFDERAQTARFPRKVEIALFRVAQEALANAMRHARASCICFAVDARSDQVTLRVTDDGVGFDPEETAGEGLGLNSMTERIETLGGTLTVDSRPGHTELVAVVPLPPEADE
jgi:PAS domain S-box-containing protein